MIFSIVSNSLVYGKYYISITFAGLPFIILFVGIFTRNPHLSIVVVAVFYMLNIGFNVYGITNNILLVGICIGSLIVSRKTFLFEPGKRFFFFLALYVLYILFSYFLVNDTFNYYEFNIYMNNVIFLLLMFLFDNESKIEVFYNAIILSALILFCSGIYQVTFLGITHRGFMTGYFANHVMYALHMAWGIPLCYYFFNKYKNKLYLLIGLLLVIGLFLAFSRGVLVALFAAICTYILIKNINKRKANKVATFLLVIVLIMSIVFTYYYLITKIPKYSEKDAFTSGRARLYTAAWKAFKKKPIYGIGWGNYKKTWSNYLPSTYLQLESPRYALSRADLALSTHSSYLRILSELGLLGLMLYLLLNYYLLKDVWAVLLKPEGSHLFIILLLYFFHGIVDNNSYGNERMFFFIAGLLYSMKHINRTSNTTGTSD